MNEQLTNLLSDFTAKLSRSKESNDANVLAQAAAKASDEASKQASSDLEQSRTVLLEAVKNAQP